MNLSIDRVDVTSRIKRQLSYQNEASSRKKEKRERERKTEEEERGGREALRPLRSREREGSKDE